LHEQTRRNLDYYEHLSDGRADYWRYMPAPRFRASVIRDLLKKERPSSIADLGCGDGGLLAQIREILPGAKYAGIDLSVTQIEENRRRLPGIEWYSGDIENESFTLPHRFAAVVSSEVIEHLADPAKFLTALRRITIPGSMLVLSTQSGRIGETEKYVGHLRHFSQKEMIELLTQTGWVPERVWNAGFPFQDLSKWFANLAPLTMIHHFGEKPYGPAQKLISAFMRASFLLNSNSRGAQLFAVARRGAE
jgi:SAM-dependent methyltransferase